MSKKQTTPKTAKAATSKPKYYIVMDSDGDLVCQGTLDEIKDEIKETIDYIAEDNTEENIREFIDGIIVYEATNGQKIKYTPSKVEL
jgi:predicted glycosyltransferase